MAKKTQAVFVSDIHAGDPDFSSGRKQLLFEFLEKYVKEYAHSLFLLGDILELVQGDLNEVLKTNLDFLLKLAEVAQSGTKLIYILGNHDYSFSSVKELRIMLPNLEIYLPHKQKLLIRGRVTDGKVEEKKPVEIYSSAHYRQVAGKTVFIAHGYEFNHYFGGDPDSFNLITKLGGILERVAGAKADDRFLHLFDSVANAFWQNVPTPALAKYDPKLEYHLAARDISGFEIKGGSYKKREKPIDYVIFGHTHKQMNWQIHDDVLNNSGEKYGTYINTGCWVIPRNGSDFTVINEKGKFDNFKWTEKGAVKTTIKL
ncbi:metallophosphoesterase [bacterium]|nr:metallophosphoesterase [bacterium]